MARKIRANFSCHCFVMKSESKRRKKSKIEEPKKKKTKVRKKKSEANNLQKEEKTNLKEKKIQVESKPQSPGRMS